MPAHDLDDGDTAMALGGGADALHAPGGDKNCRGKTGRDVVDHVFQVETAASRIANVAVAGRLVARLTQPLIGFVAIVEAEIVVDGLGRARWERCDSAIMPLRVPSPPTQIRPSISRRCKRSAISVMAPGGPRHRHNPRGAERVPPSVRSSSGMATETADSGARAARARIEKAVKAFDQTEDLDAAWLARDHGTANRGIEGGGVATGGQDPMRFMKLAIRG